MFQTVSRLRRSAITILGLSTILLCWTGGASAFHLAKKRPKVIVVEQPVHHQHHNGQPRHVFRGNDHDDDKHWKKHGKRHHQHGHRHGHHRRWHHDD